MNFDEMKNIDFYLSIGFITVISSFLTLVLTQIIKAIMKKSKAITKDMASSLVDAKLSMVGRIIASLSYVALYFINEIFILKHHIQLSGSLLTSLLTGITFTLTNTKGIYTALHQMSKKKDVYEKLEYAETIIKKLDEPIDETKKKWILTNKKEGKN